MAVDFRTNGSSLKLRARRVVHRLLDAERAPAHTVVKAVRPSANWILFFCFLPDGIVSDDHRVTIEALKRGGRKLMIVAASSRLADVADRLEPLCDALIVKQPQGYDFSGYAIGLWHIARHSPGSDVIVLNDSVLGPITDLAALLEAQPWDLTGLTSCETRGSHIQSYAFLLRGVDMARMRHLRSVFPETRAYSKYMAVVRLQESRLANVAAKHMSVGSIWHGQDDLTVFAPVDLVKMKFPFVKKSLFAKFSHVSAEDDSAFLRCVYDDFRRDLHAGRSGDGQ
ncbi:hypothetical protein GCM10011380_09100 [Sphingomonas metalli]|uniref:Uncharacterized protein n=1 Tax=Sphingomonas metalli TaxID=1779358 RepID=A0A916SY54_9SPHN|nr:rhamnan synthesis F family protein [Sphingomonas metalli]GGB21688.1 hypothetical protein GCM10011380_09100 [Sphingomonas metalli]